MRDERSYRRTILGVADDGDEHGGKFVRLRQQRIQSAGSNDIGIGQQFQPIGRLFEFLQRAFELVDEIGI